MSMPAFCLNSSPARCCVAAKPGLPNVILPGLALAAATSDLMSLYGESGSTTMNRPAVAIWPIQSNAPTGS